LRTTCLGLRAKRTASADTSLRGASQVDKNRRAVIEIHADLHQKIRKLAILNDLKIYVLASAIIEDVLSDQEKIAALIKRLKL
jgi:hypothetical protein